MPYVSSESYLLSLLPDLHVVIQLSVNQLYFFKSLILDIMDIY